MKDTDNFSPRFDEREEPEKELGLNVDMLDVDRLRDWARLIEEHGSDISHWCAPTFVVAKLRDIADRLSLDIQDVLTLRERCKMTERCGGLYNGECRCGLFQGHLGKCGPWPAVGSVSDSQQEHAVERAGAQRDQHTRKIASGEAIERRQEEHFDWCLIFSWAHICNCGAESPDWESAHPTLRPKPLSSTGPL